MPLALDSRFSPRRRYLLGISGGRDSVALLHTLLEAGAQKVVLCHLNHQLRGLFSAHDAAFVRDQAEACFEDVCLVELLCQLPKALIDKS